MTSAPSANPVERIASRVFLIRGQTVMLDSDLAALYGVPNSALNQQVKRNRDGSPAGFAFQVTESEWESLRSQIETLKPGRGRHRKNLPWAFTEHGVTMLSAILRSPQSCSGQHRRRADLRSHAPATGH